MANVVGLEPDRPHGHCLDCGAVVLATAYGAEAIYANDGQRQYGHPNGMRVLWGFEEHVCPT